jgi:transcriptional regulator with XRE-family HTH domain
MAYSRGIMDKRAVSSAFRERLRTLLGDERGGVAAFVRDTGVDRSALSQFLSPEIDRLPRAETLRRIAEARGVTVDWLLALTNAPTGVQQVAPAVQIEQVQDPAGGSPLDRWRHEAAGMKLRYVPSSLPDMLHLAPEGEGGPATPDAAPDATPDATPDARTGQPENVLGGFRLGDMDVEIAMPLQTLQDLAEGTGLWRGTGTTLRRRQLAHMAETCAEAYPALRLHLYDGRATFAAPFTVFGRIRAAVYLGEAYLVVTAAEQVGALTRLFDNLVRRSVVGPDRVHEALAALADSVRPGLAGQGSGPHIPETK